MYRLINPKTGFLPASFPDVSGFCGHTMGLFLYGLVQLNKREEAERVVSVILEKSLLGRWGTVSEFYGPGGVSNGHTYRVFESGILAEALLLYHEKYENAEQSENIEIY